MKKMIRSLLSIAITWSVVGGYWWHVYEDGPAGAYNLAVALLWAQLFLVPLALYAYSEAFAKNNPNEALALVREGQAVPKQRIPWLFDTPDYLLFAFAAWAGDGWWVAGAFASWSLGLTVRGARERAEERLLKGEER